MQLGPLVPEIISNRQPRKEGTVATWSALIDCLKEGTTTVLRAVIAGDSTNVKVEKEAFTLVANSKVITDISFHNVCLYFSKEYLATAVISSKTLNSLTLFDVDLTQEGIAYLFERLAAFSSRIKKLKIVMDVVDVMSCTAIAKALKSGNLRLQDLELSNLSIDGAMMKVLSEGFEENLTLSSLRLPGNKIGDDGLKFMAKSLEISKSCRLELLDLSYNMIGDNGACVFFNALSKIERLTSLMFDKNLLRDSGIDSLCALLKRGLKAISLTTLE